MNKNGFWQFAILLISVVSVSLFCVAPVHAKKGETDWSLGPTGARGLIEAWKHTADARKIVVTRVASRSPAEGVLQVGDVIVGVDGRDFGEDARIQFANAITRAEREESRGNLSLVCLRDGVRTMIDLRLPVMGSYSETAPYDCQKSKNIFERGCEVIAQRGMRNVSIPNSINALALLASGEAKYQSLLSDYAKKVANYRVGPMATWHYGYAITFLAEYALATGDPSIMPGLRRLSLEAAHGQSKVGTWGHRFAMPDGRVGGYGCMNSPGIPLTISLVLAREAGVKDPAMDVAIARSARFLRWYVDKGAIPYGDHAPWPGHEDNGKCSMAAVLFDLLEDTEAAEFFAKMSTAGYDERERGHTGNFFNVLWAMPAVSRGGPLATAAYWREQGWYYDFARQSDGSFRYQGSPAGEEEHGSYKNWDNTGTYLLAYALPLKSLYLTGKKRCSVSAFNSDEVVQVIAAGRGYFSSKENDRYRYKARADNVLLKGLSSWSPAARKRSAEELANRRVNVQSTLLKLIESEDRYSRYGAAEALGHVGRKGSTDDCVSALLKAFESEDLTLRIVAAEALARIGQPAQAAVPAMLERLASPDRENDPRGMEQRILCFSLFNRRGGLIGRSLDGVDRTLLLRAVRVGLQNEDGRARGSLETVYANLSYDEIKPFLPAIHQAIVEPAPSGIMFASGIRVSGVELLAKHRIREGMPLCIQIMEIDKWGKKNRITKCLKTLESYGPAAKAVLPELRQLEKDLRSHSEARMLAPVTQQVTSLIKKINTAEDTAELRSITDA
ncbi:DUF6288 domain-containing protein [Rubripirellula sp.]|nr:DUF6288 domain-containing protein [Rubripirellula sp.]